MEKELGTDHYLLGGGMDNLGYKQRLALKSLVIVIWQLVIKRWQGFDKKRKMTAWLKKMKEAIS